MRISQQFRLGVTQGALDFVDVDTSSDTPVYIDPKAIRLQEGEWAASCQVLLQNFFKAFLESIQKGDSKGIDKILKSLGEPNETHLGVSEGKSRGRGLGSGEQGAKVVEALQKSRAGSTGLLEDLEDSVLFIEGIGRDIISDMTTNIIRGPLIEYTQNKCRFYGIPMEKQTAGLVWDHESGDWTEPTVYLPRSEFDKLILVPKSIVRLDSIVDRGKYFRGYLRPYFEDEELRNPGSSFVKTLKDGSRKVRLQSLAQMIGTDKPSLVKNTERFPSALDDYKKSFTPEKYPPMDARAFEEDLGAETTDYRALLESVQAVLPGKPGAHAYHLAVAALLTAIFDSCLANEKLEEELHEGRKRLDIQYDNVAATGFFRWLSLNYDSSTLVVEAKNYTSDVKNEQLDQLTGRFGPHRGKVGILVCRRVDDREKLVKRCVDAAKDDRGFILVLTDSDFETLVAEAEDESVSESERREFLLLRDQFQALIQ